MRTHEVTLAANETIKATLNGNFFVLLSAQAPVDMQFLTVDGGQNDISKGIEAGYSEQFTEQLTAVYFTSATAQVIKYGYAKGAVSFDRVVNVTSLQQSTVITNTAPATVSTSAASVLAASATRKRIVFTADSANAGTIYLGGSGISTTNGAIMLTSGDSWIEDTAAAAQWYAVASIAGQTLRISEA